MKGIIYWYVDMAIPRSETRLNSRQVGEATSAKPPHPLSAGKSAKRQGSLAQLEVMAMRIRQNFSSSLLRSEIKKIIPSPPRLRAPAYLLAAAILMLLLAARSTALAQSVTGNLRAVSGDFNAADRILPSTKAIYQTNYRSNTIEVFSLRGLDRGTFATPANPTGLVFDDAGNLYVSSDNRAAYSILKFAPDGTGSVFANSDLSGPHALVFDTAGNLYVANNLNGNTIVKFTPDGVGTVFADAN